MRRTPIILGILSMVFGGLVALWNGFSLVSQTMVKDWSSTFSKLGALAPHREGQPDPAKAMEAMGRIVEQLKPYTLAISGGMVLLSLVLCVIGFGLYKRARWSRAATILWSLVALAFIPFRIFVETRIVMPRMHDVMAQMFADSKMPGLADSMMGMQSGVAILSAIIFFAPFPIILLFLMGRQSAKGDLLS